MTLLVLGGINEDVVVHVEALPRPGETVMSRGIDRAVGGKGLNKAVAAARFGGDVCLLGAIGDDPAGAMLRNVLQQAGVDDRHLIVDPRAPSGQAFITLAEDGENCIVVNAGANAGIAAPDIARQPITAHVYLAEFEAPVAAVHALFATPASQAGIRILNAAPALPEGRATLALADIVILNETELEAYCAGHPTAAEADIVAAARMLIDGGERRIVVTLGAAGCLLVEADRYRRFMPHEVKAIDTIGAGDCFCGVFAAALAEGMEIAAAIEQANAAAAISVGRRGAAAASPIRAEITGFLERESA
ncbi:ribokinase [Sphingomonas nostoxanthinifaciens]|uniref:ribokinase n=1 Tax=Sphingomonas nostoxanthinifaciens TaxID=2872652 RepID=UPI001CC1EEA2|nr:ribokinase [Sphingomonas nostoxanthinifaciens]UAK25644.1 ribokinase [Sphingomonas nostoxanthinifaciens]